MVKWYETKRQIEKKNKTLPQKNHRYHLAVFKHSFSPFFSVVLHSGRSSVSTLLYLCKKTHSLQFELSNTWPHPLLVSVLQLFLVLKSTSFDFLEGMGYC